jgi:hypothetical protein
MCLSLILFFISSSPTPFSLQLTTPSLFLIPHQSVCTSAQQFASTADGMRAAETMESGSRQIIAYFFC